MSPVPLYPVSDDCGLLGGIFINSKMVILTSSMSLWSHQEKCFGTGLSWWPLVMPPKCPTNLSNILDATLVACDGID